jgi:hypothetical protein
MLNARRRQQIALGVSGGVLAAFVGVVVWLLARRRR